MVRVRLKDPRYGKGKAKMQEKFSTASYSGGSVTTTVTRHAGQLGRAHRHMCLFALEAISYHKNASAHIASMIFTTDLLDWQDMISFLMSQERNSSREREAICLILKISNYGI